MSSSAAATAATAAAEKETRHYTRRTTRQRVVDLLREAIELVEKRCAEPAKGTLLPASVAASSSSSAPAETLTTSLFAPVNSKKPKTPKATVTAAAMNGSSSNSQTLKVKKMASCPGGPKAFNEFLKKERPRVEAELGPSATYANVRRKISANWKAQCGASNSKTRKTAKTAATPGRVNAKVPLLSAVPEGAEENSSNTTPRNNANATNANARNVNANANARNANSNKGYENLGMDDTLGMRKIRIGNRDLFMTEANSGLFEREDDMNPGGFVGYLKNGRIVESNSPENENSLM